MAHALVRDTSDADLLLSAGRMTGRDAELNPIYTPAFIVGKLVDRGGGMIFETISGVDGGPTIRFFTLAEIKVAPYRNMAFIHERDSYNALPDPGIGSGKFVLPYGVAQQYGVI